MSKYMKRVIAHVIVFMILCAFMGVDVIIIGSIISMIYLGFAIIKDK